MLGSRVSKKGQITIPLRIRKALGLLPGDHVRFRIRRGAVEMVRDGGASEHSIRGCVDAGRPEGIQVSLEQMEKAIEDSVTDDWD